MGSRAASQELLWIKTIKTVYININIEYNIEVVFDGLLLTLSLL
jgi:hypothetical protein